MPEYKAPRNKTITLTEEEEKKYLSRCVEVEETVANISDVLNKTIHGDIFAVLPLLPDKSVDLIFADPPYNISRTFGSTSFGKKKDTDYADYTKTWLEQAKRVLKDNGSIYVCSDWQTGLIIGRIMAEYFTVQNRITWQREKGRGAKANWKSAMEDIWYGTKSSSYTFNLDAVKIRRKVLARYKIDGQPKDWEETDEGNFRNTCPSNFWDDITVPFWSMPENTEHPTQKPEKLLAKVILASSNPDDIVLDPFLGSGTSSVVAKKLDRQFIGIEPETKYCALAEKRLEMASTDKSIQGYFNGTFFDRNTPVPKS